MKKTAYQPVVKRIFEKLGVGQGGRSEEEDRKIKEYIYEATAKEVLAFIWDSLDPLKQAAFEADIEETQGDLEKISHLITSYLQIIPDYQIRLEERLKVFETALYHRLLSS